MNLPVTGKEDVWIESIINLIQIPTPTELVIHTKLRDTTFAKIDFSGIRAIRTTSMATNNILDCITVWSVDDLLSSYNKELIWLLTGRYEDNIPEEYIPVYKEYTRKIQLGRLKFIQVEPVIGIELLVLCKSVTWLKKKNA